MKSKSIIAMIVQPLMVESCEVCGTESQNLLQKSKLTTKVKSYPWILPQLFHVGILMYCPVSQTILTPTNQADTSTQYFTNKHPHEKYIETI